MEDTLWDSVQDSIFDLDEVMPLKWEDDKPDIIMIPGIMPSQTIDHGANRNLKHITIVR
jgi:hypothetical protein